MEKLLRELALSIREGKAKRAKNLVVEAVERGISAEEIVNEGMSRAMDDIIRSLETDTAFIPEVILSARAMNVATVVLEDMLCGYQRPVIGTVVAATVKDDLHDIGLNLVCMMLRNEGFTVYNMGCDVSADEIIRKAEEVNADIICLSAMLTTTIPRIQRTVKLLENRGLRRKYKVMVGGAPVTQRFAERIGADIYTSNAVEAARQAKTLIQKERQKNCRCKKDT